MNEVVLSCGVEPTICKVGMDLGVDRHLPARRYIIENRRRSDLALGKSCVVTHDVFEAERLTIVRSIVDEARAVITASLMIASTLALDSNGKQPVVTRPLSAVTGVRGTHQGRRS